MTKAVLINTVIVYECSLVACTHHVEHGVEVLDVYPLGGPSVDNARNCDHAVVVVLQIHFQSLESSLCYSTAFVNDVI